MRAFWLYIVNYLPLIATHGQGTERWSPTLSVPSPRVKDEFHFGQNTHQTNNTSCYYYKPIVIMGSSGDHGGRGRIHHHFVVWSEFVACRTNNTMISPAIAKGEGTVTFTTYPPFLRLVLVNNIRASIFCHADCSNIMLLQSHFLH